jgi:hypothetical protein
VGRLNTGVLRAPRLQSKIFGIRKLIPNREHVTWREPTVTSINFAISSREIPCVPPNP